LKRGWVAHDIRDAIVDFVRQWNDKTDIPACRFVVWLGISTSKFHDWKARFGKVNEHNALVPRDHWITDDERQRICQFARAHPLEGYRHLAFMMLDAGVVACSPATVYRVLKAANLLAGSTPAKSKKGTGFVQPLAAHDHWHIDISYLKMAGTYYFLCSILDGFSRTIIHWEIREKMEVADVQIVVQRGREKYPHARPRIISDNGPQFIARDFKEFVRIAEMTHVKTSPYYPQSNGKIERWHKTIKGEAIRIQVPLCVEEGRKVVADFVRYYNGTRLHGAIGYIAPLDKLEGKAEAIHRERDRKLAEAREHRRIARQRERQQERQQERDNVFTCVDARPAIDFAAVKAHAKIEDVLRLLGTTGQTRRNQHRGPCPLHPRSKGTARCFSANLEKNLFQCFKCGAGGDAIDLWAKAQRKTPYDAAIDLAVRLNLNLPAATPPPSPTEPVKPLPPTTTLHPRDATTRPTTH
jgi:putative transposase